MSSNKYGCTGCQLRYKDDTLTEKNSKKQSNQTNKNSKNSKKSNGSCDANPNIKRTEKRKTKNRNKTKRPSSSHMLVGVRGEVTGGWHPCVDLIFVCLGLAVKEVG